MIIHTCAPHGTVGSTFWKLLNSFFSDYCI
jgi:hypothetical protein